MCYVFKPGVMFPSRIYGPMSMHVLKLPNDRQVLLFGEKHWHNEGSDAVYVVDAIEGAEWIDEVHIEISTVLDANITRRGTSGNESPLFAALHRGHALPEKPGEPVPLAPRLRFADVRRAGIFWLLSAVSEPGTFLNVYEPMFPDFRASMFASSATTPAGARRSLAFRLCRRIERGFFQEIRKRDTGLAFFRSLVVAGGTYPAWLRSARDEVAGYGMDLADNPVHTAMARLAPDVQNALWVALEASWATLLDAPALQTQERSTSKGVLERSYVVRMMSLCMDAYIVAGILASPRGHARAYIIGDNHANSIVRILVRMQQVLQGSYSVGKGDDGTLNTTDMRRITLGNELGAPVDMLEVFRRSFARRHPRADAGAESFGAAS